MKQKLKGLFFWLILCSSFITNTVNAEDFSSRPQTNLEKPYRIAYYQGGGNEYYYDYLYVTTESLIKLGWIEPLIIPHFSDKNSRQLWLWLSDNIKSRYIEFVADGYYSANWDNNIRHNNRELLISRFNNIKDINMVFAMGTWAGQDLANNRHHVPTIVISSSDPLRSGIIKSTEDSGLEHLFSSYDPELQNQQIKIFHKLIKFKKLGVPYENTTNGRSYAGMDLIESASVALGFEIVPCYTQSDITDQKLAEKSVIGCFDKLINKVDAIFISDQGGVNNRSTPKLTEIANHYGIPTFSQSGERDVRYGYLLSLSRKFGFGPEGMFLAENIGKIINGAKPNNLKQLFDGEYRITLNMKTAKEIGLYLNADLLATADKLYWHIELPE